MAKSRLHELSELGQSVWIDFLSRQMLQSGKLAEMMEKDAVVGVTSNPTIFQKAIAGGDAYDEQMREVLAEEQDPKEVFLKLAVQDVKNACDLLRPVWDGGRTATSRSRSIRTSPPTHRGRSTRRSGCTSSWTSPTAS